MSKLRILVPTLVVIAMLLLPTVIMAQPSVCGFYGSVTLDGAPAADGTTVTASIDGVEVKSVTTSGGDYVMRINGTYDGMTVVFAIGAEAISAGATPVFAAGENLAVDLISVREATQDAEIRLSPASGLYSAVSGEGFTPNAAITVTFDGEEVGSATADAGGRFVALIASPTSVDGTYTIAATDATDRMAEASFEVVQQGTVAPVDVEALTAQITESIMAGLADNPDLKGADGIDGIDGADGEDGDDGGSAVLGIVAIVIAVIAVVLVFVMKPKAPAAA